MQKLFFILTCFSFVNAQKRRRPVLNQEKPVCQGQFLFLPNFTKDTFLQCDFSHLKETFLILEDKQCKENTMLLVLADRFLYILNPSNQKHVKALQLTATQKNNIKDFMEDSLMKISSLANVFFYVHLYKLNVGPNHFISLTINNGKLEESLLIIGNAKESQTALIKLDNRYYIFNACNPIHMSFIPAHLRADMHNA